MLRNFSVQVANFCGAEDDATFWSRWIKPEAVAHAEVYNSTLVGLYTFL